MTTAAKGIAEIITVPGYVNVDFMDVQTVMKDAGAAVMGSASTEGEGRALRAAEMAISSPLLNSKDIHGAQKILLSIVTIALGGLAYAQTPASIYDISFVSPTDLAACSDTSQYLNDTVTTRGIVVVPGNLSEGGLSCLNGEPSGAKA